MIPFQRFESSRFRMSSPYRPYYQYLVVAFWMSCGCLEIRNDAIDKDDVMHVCEKHSQRIKEIVARRQPLVDEPFPIVEGR